jgi:hypothetical protein
MFSRKTGQLPEWALAAAGAAAGAGAVAFAVARVVRRRAAARQVAQPRARELSGLAALEDAAVETLRRDPVTGVCGIDVAAMAPSTIELTGVVPTPDVGQRAASLLQGMPEVSAVLNRLEIGTLEQRLAANRELRAQGEPRLRERRWYGVRVGTGRRRQSPATEPPRPDDSLERRTRALEVGAAEPSDIASPPPAHRHGSAAERPL